MRHRRPHTIFLPTLAIAGLLLLVVCSVPAGDRHRDTPLNSHANEMGQPASAQAGTTRQHANFFSLLPRSLLP
ncbi:MAG: hypothetical protein Q4G62_05940 [Pseudomonadota bacterium]|nr:hypothetical protein [Pseudomonadota bacterium]